MKQRIEDEMKNSGRKFLDVFGPHYHEYVHAVSHKWNIVSYEMLSVIFERTMARIDRAEKETRRFLDLGGGSPSILFRVLKECKMLPENSEIFYVDDNTIWLERTTIFLERMGISIENSLTWNEFLEIPPATFDVIAFDIGLIGRRQEYFDYILRHLLDKETDLWLDDMHRNELKMELMQMITRCSESYCSEFFESLAEPETGRYGVLVNEIVVKK